METLQIFTQAAPSLEDLLEPAIVATTPILFPCADI